MARKRLERPTSAELAILRVLWERGPSTVRQVHDILSEEREFAYTTTLKFMQLMTEKGMLTREADGRTHRYHAAYPEEATQQRLIVDLLERAFGGSSAKLVIQALTARPASAEDLREIRRILASAKARTADNSQKEKDRD